MRVFFFLPECIMCAVYISGFYESRKTYPWTPATALRKTTPEHGWRVLGKLAGSSKPSLLKAP